MSILLEFLRDSGLDNRTLQLTFELLRKEDVTVEHILSRTVSEDDLKEIGVDANAISNILKYAQEMNLASQVQVYHNYSNASFRHKYLEILLDSFFLLMFEQVCFASAQDKFF